MIATVVIISTLIMLHNYPFFLVVRIIKFWTLRVDSL